jgi:EmrB/QacA subfamily drug resistance transporter
MRISEKSARAWVLGLTAAASFMVALDTLVVSTALSTVRADLGASIEELEWTVNAYNLSFAVLLMSAAALGDRFGRRRLYATGLGLFAAASAACALAPDVGWLIAARAVQGIGAAFVAPLALALATAAFPPERRGAAIGILGAVTGLAVASGPLIGGAVVEGIDWEWIFWLNVPIGLAAIPLTLGRIKESFGPDTALDVRGLALVTGAAFGLVWGLVRGNAAGWASLEVLASLVAGAVLTAGFVAWQLRAPEPMLPMRFFRSRAFSAGNAGIFLALASLFGAVFLMAQYLQATLGYGPLETGLRMLPWTGLVMFVAPITGALADRFGERPFMVGGLSMQAAGMAWIGLIAEPSLAYSELVTPLLISGAGIATAIIAAQSSVVGSVATTAIGKASGTNTMMRELGGVFGIAIAVAVFAGTGSFASPETFTDGFAPAMGVAAGLAALGAIVSLTLPGQRAPETSGTATAVPAFETEGGP